MRLYNGNTIIFSQYFKLTIISFDMPVIFIITNISGSYENNIGIAIFPYCIDYLFYIVFEMLFCKPRKSIINRVLYEDTIGVIMKNIPPQAGETGIRRITRNTAINKLKPAFEKLYVKHFV